MKICLVNTFDQTGGAAIAAQRLAIALQKNSHSVTMLVDKKEGENSISKQVSESPFHKYFQKLRFALDRLYFLFFEKNKSVRFAFSTANIGADISQNKYVLDADIIHLHWVNFGFLSMGSIAKLLALNKPVVVTMHDMWWFTGGCHFADACNNFKIECGNCDNFLANANTNDLSHKSWLNKKQLLLNANINFVGCSNWMADLAKESSLLNAKFITNIPNPIDTDFFKPIDKSVLLSKYNLTSHKKYILFGAANLGDKRKGFLYLKEALILLQNNHSEILEQAELLVFGKSNNEILEGINFKVNYFGKINSAAQIVEIYNLATVFVCPSVEDNLPNTIMEAMACATPVVGFNTGGIPEMVEHNQTGYLAEYKNSADLAQGILQCLDEKKSEMFSKNSRKKVLENYHETVIADKYINLYKNFI